MEANHPAAGLLLGMAVEVLPVEVGEKAVGVAGVFGQERFRFLRLQHKAHTAHNVANERLPFV